MMIFIIEITLVMFGAISLDLLFGDPKSRYHPTAWAGSLIACVIPYFAGRSHIAQKMGGATAVVIPVFVALLGISALYYTFDYIACCMSDIEINNHASITLDHILYMAAYILAGCVLLKCTIAIRGMQEHAKAVTRSLQASNVPDAQTRLSMIVKRQTSELDEAHIISGTLESIGENIADGVTGSLFYFGLFGVPGAFVHRITSTADSMIGYKSSMLKRLGWFAAHSDTILNYLPARLTALAMVVASFILKGCNGRAAYRTMYRDKNLTLSRNSGYTMAALAGALNVKLEKKGQYVLGAEFLLPTIRDVDRAISLMKLTIIVFATIVVLPIGAAAALLTNMIFGGIL